MDAARQRAGLITAQVTGMAEHLVSQMHELVGELRTLADPGAAEAQLEAAASEAAERAEKELQTAREKAEYARLQQEAQKKAAEEKKAQQGFSVEPLDIHTPEDLPSADDRKDDDGPADL